MAEGNSTNQGQRVPWNLNNIPVNMNRAETYRMRENLSRVVRDLLPELGNQPGVLMGPSARLQSSVINMEDGPGAEGNVDTGAAGVGVGRAAQLAARSHSHGHAHSHYHPYSVTHGHTHAGTAQSTAHAHSEQFDQDSGASLVINIGADNFSRASPDHHNHSDETEPDENQNMTGSPGHTHGEGSPQAFPLRSLYKMMEGSLPFLLFLFAKIMYNHRLGILVFVGLCLTFCYANKTLKKHIAQRDGPLVASSTHLVWIIAFLAANIAVLYYVFRDQQLHNSLMLQLPAFEHIDLWLLLWIIGITDFVIKFGAIILKAAIALLPRPVLPHKKRGKYYMMIEHVSQFYRCLVPIIPWIAFLQDDKQGGPWFAYFLLVVYTVCKGQHMWKQAKDLRQAFSKFQVDVDTVWYDNDTNTVPESYGSCPSRDDLSTSDNCCPICQDKFNEPVKLSCKHIFCEDCVSMWFDRERTCPMCRANIVDDPVWRDGATSSNLQLF